MRCPAVTVPSLANAGLSLARSSTVTSGRMCSSVSTVTVPFRLLISIGGDLLLEVPGVGGRRRAVVALARRARPGLARETPYSVATFSAVTPMWQASNGSVSAPVIASTADAVLHPLAPAHGGQPVRDPAHRLRAAGHRDVAVAELDRLRGRHDRLQPAAAQPVQGERRRLHREAAVDRRDPATGTCRGPRCGSRCRTPRGPHRTGSTPARLTASRTIVAARSQGGTAASPPPYLPIGVRTPDRTNTSCWSLSIAPPLTCPGRR